MLSSFDLLYDRQQASNHARPAQTGTAMNRHSFIFTQFFQQFLHMRYILRDAPIWPLGIMHMPIFSPLKRDSADSYRCIFISGRRRVDLSIGSVVKASYFSALDDVAQHRHALHLAVYYHLLELRLRVLQRTLSDNELSMWHGHPVRINIALSIGLHESDSAVFICIRVDSHMDCSG